MAVTTLAQIPLGYLPVEVGPGPFPHSGYSSWYSIRQMLVGLVHDCVAKREGGMRWIRKLECPFTQPKGEFRY